MGKEWHFRSDVEPQGSSDGFWYDIANGYIRPEELLTIPGGDELMAFTDALKTLQSFEAAMVSSGLYLEI